MAKLQKKTKTASKVRSIRLSSKLDARIERVKEAAEAMELDFNLSALVEKLLDKEIAQMEKQVGKTQDIDEDEGQQDLFKK